MKLDNNNHSVFKLNYRLILTVKNLNKVIVPEISDRLKEIFDNISPNYNITWTTWEYTEDHIDIVFKAHPNTELSKFINAYKSAGSRLIKKEFPDVQDKLQEGQFWSKSFCLLTLGEMNEDVIGEYRNKQGTVIHRKKSTIHHSKEEKNV